MSNLRVIINCKQLITNKQDNDKKQQKNMAIEFDNVTFDLPKNTGNLIKVIGVGGGASPCR